jgi:hypothetical protein
MTTRVQRLRFAFWAAAFDVCDALCLYCVGKMSDATDWGPPLDEYGAAPWGER